MGDYSHFQTKPGFVEKRIALASDYARKLAEKQWEGCHHCDETDKQMWMNGFVAGYLNSLVEESNIFKCKYCGGEDKGQ
jgi:hypothetical protein